MLGSLVAQRQVQPRQGHHRQQTQPKQGGRGRHGGWDERRTGAQEGRRRLCHGPRVLPERTDSTLTTLIPDRRF